jgi:tRNA1(Val) A37 N6-methylase TrmN6
MIDNQFYPTPPHLVEIAWGKFKTRNVTALLEPSAGRANLLERSRGHNNHAVNITDCIESMADNIAVLKQKNFRVVDTDFLNFRTSKLYSHIIMNPPFANGV